MLQPTKLSTNQTGGTSRKGPHYFTRQCVQPDTAFLSHGPIVEQGTHFCDLSRYFGGDVDISSVSAHSLDWDEKAGRLSKMRIDESKISPENRIPRVTAATWWAALVPFSLVALTVIAM